MYETLVNTNQLSNTPAEAVVQWSSRWFYISHKSEFALPSLNNVKTTVVSNDRNNATKENGGVEKQKTRFKKKGNSL